MKNIKEELSNLAEDSESSREHSNLDTSFPGFSEQRSLETNKGIPKLSIKDLSKYASASKKKTSQHKKYREE